MSMTKQQFLTSSGLHVQTLELWLDQEWLVPEKTSGGARFTDIDIARARLIRELKDEFGANDAGIDVILHLVDQLHGMRRALVELRKEMQEEH